ncbi:MAG: hypothetical protein ACTSWF_12795 [Candidatus Freyarchaeota archaeon]
MHDVAAGIQNLPITHPDLLQESIFLGFFQNLHVSNALEGFIGVTFILGLLIAVTLILVALESTDSERLRKKQSAPWH